MNKLRIHIIILISAGILASCSASFTSKYQQPTMDEAKRALIGLVKSNSNIFPDSVFEDPKDPSTLNIIFTEPGHYSSGCVLVHLEERTYEIWVNYEWGNEFETHYWKGAFIQTMFDWEATMPIGWKEWGTFTETLAVPE